VAVQKTKTAIDAARASVKKVKTLKALKREEARIFFDPA
jgi:hypothetical protein